MKRTDCYTIGDRILDSLKERGFNDIDILSILLYSTVAHAIENRVEK